MRPVRLQLSRRKGFNLQALSQATNGLPAVNVARPGKWGNPAAIGDYFKVGDPDPRHAGAFRMTWCRTTKEFAHNDFTYIDSAETAVEMFRRLANATPLYANTSELRGKNLACWCRPGAPCHAAVLLELANADACTGRRG